MEKESVGQRFTQLIQQLGLSKNAFAMSLDKTATVIQHLVDERNKPGYDLICKVFEVYPNVSKDWLLLGQGPMLLGAASPPAAPTTLAAAPPPAAPTKPLPDAPVTPNFPAPLFTVVAARPAAPTPLPAVAEPASEPLAAAPPGPPAAVTPPAPDVAQAALQPEAAPPLAAPVASPAALATPPPPVPDATYLTAALHAQYLQHQLDLAEQRNQHLIQQQQLMQQMLDLLKRPA